MIMAWHRSNQTSKRLNCIPGVGPLLATALVASVADPKTFRSGRNFSAWIGLVPKQHSSGGRDRLGSISKQGDRYLRSLFVAGALAVEVHGRRRAGLLRLSPGARGRRRAGRARRAGVGRGGGWSQDPCGPADARRHRNGTGGRRRSDRLRRCSGAGIVGETPNLAARLQGIAEPNSVVIAESTRKLVGNLFELEDLGAQNLKGIEGPVRAWAALRPSFGREPLRRSARWRTD